MCIPTLARVTPTGNRWAAAAPLVAQCLRANDPSVHTRDAHARTHPATAIVARAWPLVLLLLLMLLLLQLSYYFWGYRTPPPPPPYLLHAIIHNRRNGRATTIEKNFKGTLGCVCVCVWGKYTTPQP